METVKIVIISATAIFIFSLLLVFILNKNTDKKDKDEERKNALDTIQTLINETSGMKTPDKKVIIDRKRLPVRISRPNVRGFPGSDRMR
jgi:uncharacterized alpha/beta hydrolase family protein